jgi:hypothetical protein
MSNRLLTALLGSVALLATSAAHAATPAKPAVSKADLAAHE